MARGACLKFIVTASISNMLGLAPATLATPLPDFDNYTPTIDAVKITASDAPNIDGKLDEAVWNRADELEILYTARPNVGETPPGRTTARILYDDDNLYVAMKAFDPTPEDIRASVMVRDRGLFPDDRMVIILDPSNTQRNGYYFEVNPNGSRFDALIENNQDTLGQWDTIWQARATQTADGWVAEVAIPFRSISYDTNADSWGLQITRVFREEDIVSRWANVSRVRNGIDLTRVGRLENMDIPAQGRGLDVELLGTAIASYDWPGDEGEARLEPSANLYYRFTPNLTGTLTLNTDFSDTPLDSRQVNTGRFSLFFPETRDFFLQDAAVFEFGGRVFNDVNGLPFFSRRIGIVDGQPADIIAGGKLSGQLGQNSIGALVTQTDEVPFLNRVGKEESLDGQLLSSVRVSRQVSDQLKAGLTLTSGDPTGETDALTGGVDLQYTNDGGLLPGIFLADFALVQTRNEDEVTGEVSDDTMVALALDYTGDKWGWFMDSRQIGEDYDPKLGFANRTGIRQVNARGRRTFRSDGPLFREIRLNSYGRLVTDLDGERLDSVYGIGGRIENHTGDGIFGDIDTEYQRVRDGFDLAGRIPVPAGEYEGTEIEGGVYTGSARPLSVQVFALRSDIYNGTRTVYSPEMTWRPSKYFALALDYTFENFDLPLGELDIHVGTVESDLNFTPDMSLSTEIQYDNISENLAWFSRFFWERQPGQEITVSFGHTADVAEDDFPRDFVSQNTSLSLRVGQTFRF